LKSNVYVNKTITGNIGNVKECIIKQIEMDCFTIEYVSEKKLSERQIIVIHKAVDLYLEPNLKLKFHQKLILATSNRGKLKQFSSLVQ
jgi:phenylacetate-CoA ligase